MIDYSAAQKLFRKHKGLLTRALNKKEPKQRYEAVLSASTQFVRDFAAIDAPWPDDWSRWQRAIVDAANDYTRATGVFVNAPRLEDLEGR